MPPIVVSPRFKRRFNKKTAAQRAAIMRCLTLLERNERHPGLNAHQLRGSGGVWEAYVNSGDRVTYHREDSGRLVLRMNCNHDQVLRSP
jgi:mRNA-degrading endonuclease YafQ of YafQ-DinJ toxin-antitoxin module